MSPSLRSSAFVVVVACSTLVSCGGHDDALPTPQELSDALLTVTDMDAGWTETQRQVFTERSPENPSIDPSVWCPEATAIAEPLTGLAGQSGADVEMQFESTPGVNHMMRLQAWANADAEEYPAVARAAVAACDGYSGVDVNGVETSVAVIDDHTLGDESVMWSEQMVPRADTQDEKLEYRGRTTVARFNDVVMVLQFGDAGFAGTTSPADDDWWSIVEAAADKLSPLGCRSSACGGSDPTQTVVIRW